MENKKEAFLKSMREGGRLSRSLYCPAKINLFLEVTGKREDGYHTIESVMQKIALCDRVEVTLSHGEGVTITSNDRTLPTGEKNLCHRALTAYLQRANITAHADIDIYKKIPVSAGLAGGSTDAAGVLKALDDMIGALSKNDLAALALSIGADVPFCLFRSAAICRGLGEKLSPVTPLADCYLVVVKHRRESVSTKEAYQMIDSLDYTELSADGMAEALMQKDLSAISREMKNRFEDVILTLRPSVALFKKILLENGALAAMMSGSGPSVFGIFEREEDAQKAREALRQENCYAFVTRPWR